MSLFEFSHLSPRMRQVSLGSPGRLVTLPPCDYSNSTTPMVITLRGGLAHSQVVVRDPRLKEKVVVAINAARAARRQAEEVRYDGKVSKSTEGKEGFLIPDPLKCLIKAINR